MSAKKFLIGLFFVLLTLGMASAAFSDAAFSGEIMTGFQGWQRSSDDLDPDLVGSGGFATDYTFGKMVLNGSLGDDLTGVLVFKDADNKYTTAADNMTSLVVDEASLTFTEDWGTLKLGYFGWNDNLTDILNVWTDDIKSQTTVAYSNKLTDNLHFSMAMAYTGTGTGTVHDPWINDGTVFVSGSLTQEYTNYAYLITDTRFDPVALSDYSFSSSGVATDLNVAQSYKNAFGGDLGFTSGNVGGDLLYLHYNDNDSAWGINLFAKLGNFRPFLEYRNFQSNASKQLHSPPELEEEMAPFAATVIEPYNLINTIVGITYESDESPFYARAEVDLNGTGFFAWSAHYVNPDDDTYYYYNAKYPYSGNPWGVRLGYKLQKDVKIEAQYFHTGFDADSAFWWLDGWSELCTISVPQNKYCLKLICSF